MHGGQLTITTLSSYVAAGFLRLYYERRSGCSALCSIGTSQLFYSKFSDQSPSHACRQRAQLTSISGASSMQAIIYFPVCVSVWQRFHQSPVYCGIQNGLIPSDILTDFGFQPVGSGLWCARLEFCWVLLRQRIINACLPPPDL